MAHGVARIALTYRRFGKWKQNLENHNTKIKIHHTVYAYIDCPQIRSPLYHSLIESLSRLPETRDLHQDTCTHNGILVFPAPQNIFWHIKKMPAKILN